MINNKSSEDISNDKSFNEKNEEGVTKMYDFQEFVHFFFL